MPFTGISERSPTGSPEISPQGLVLAYDMNTLTPRGGMRDLSGEGNDGRVIGTTSIPGPFGPARAFRTASDYIDLPPGKSLHLRGPVSIAVWVKFARLGVHQHLVSYDDLYTLWVRESDRFRFSDTQGDAFESDGRIVTPGEWHPIVASFSGGAGTDLDGGNIAVYLDGHAVPGRAIGTWNPGRPVEGYVGKESHAGRQFHIPFLGEIAAVLVFRRALTAGEALAFADTPTVRIASSQASPNAPRIRPLALGGNSPSLAAPHALLTELQEEPVDPGRRPRAERRIEISLAPEPVSAGHRHWLTALPRAGAGIPRVVRITNILPPYRHRTLELLQASPIVRFEQWLMAAAERNRRWSPPPGDSVRVFRDWGIDLSHRNMASVHFNPGMIRELRARPPDLVILGGYEQPTCLLTGLMLDGMGIPFLLSSEGIDLGDSPTGRWVPSLVRELVNRSAGIIVAGRASRQHMLDLGAHADRIFVAPNAVDVRRFGPAESEDERKSARRILGLPDRTVCLYVGRLTDDKGIRDLLDAFGAVRPEREGLHLVLVGDGPLRPVVERRLVQDPALRETVTLVGYAPEELLPEYYRAADMFLFPTRRDIWGLVLNEAMSAGLPVISSDGAAATLDLIDDGETGLTFPRGRSGDLEAAILRLHEDPGLRHRMGREARRRILGGFTPEDQAEGFLDAIMTTLKRLGHLEVEVPKVEARA